MDVVTVIKEHPLSIVAAAVVLLVIISSSKSSNGSGAYAASLQSQQIATGANVSISKIRSDETVGLGAQFASMFASSQTNAAKLASDRSTLAASMFDTLTKTDAQFALADTGAILQRSLAQMQSGNVSKQLDNQLFIASKSIDAGITTNRDKLNAAITLDANSGNRQLTALGMSLDEKKYEVGVTAQNLPTILQHSENLAKISASNAQAITSINSEAARAVASAQANSTNANTIASIIGMITGKTGTNTGSGSSGGSGGFDFSTVADVVSSFF